jgi:Uncharacterized protein related to capsule biosynthesis enzymes
MPWLGIDSYCSCDESLSLTKVYADLVDAIGEHCYSKMIMSNRSELFARMVYNIFVSNDDDHFRNHGFICDPNLGDWCLFFFYDVMLCLGISYER